MKIYKNVSFLAILLLLTVTLAACGDNTATSGPAAAPTTSAASTTMAASTTPPAMTTAAMTTSDAMTSMAASTTMASTTSATTMAAMTSMPAMTTPAAMTTAAPSTTSGKTMEITISNFSFMPDTLTIPVGTRVIWTNKDSVGHTVTSDDTGGPLKSPLIDQGKTFEYTFDKAGTYSYHCEPHPFMKGKVIVQ